MSEPCCSVRTDETKDLLAKLDKYFKNWQELDFISALYGVDLKQVFRDIDRARRRFDSKLFLIVVFGPLKAGKSTLTNALAGEYVSPAGFGKETTRRPSLIMFANESGIDQYFSKDSVINHALHQGRRPGNDREKRSEKSDHGHDQIIGTRDTVSDKEQNINVREAFELVTDYLRGVRAKEDIDPQIRIEKLPLNPKILEKMLTEDLTTEPLFTVIRCSKGGDLLRHKVVIVDMPGLDGSRSNWREDPIHEWVISQAEFFLFCQSSVAAINSETRDFVTDVLGKSTKPPIYHFQNIFDARYWQPPQKRLQA